MAVILTNLQSAAAATTTVTISNYDTSVVRPNRVLVVCAALTDATTAETIDDVTFNAVSLTKGPAAIGSVSSVDVRSEIWWMADPDGTADVVVTCSATPTRVSVSAFMLDGAVSQAPEATASNTDTSTPIGPFSLTTLTDGAFLVDHTISSIGSTFAPTETDQVEIFDNDTGDYQRGISTRQAGDAGSYGMGHTQTSASNVAHVITAWEDAGAWISNFVSALTQGNEDAAVVDGAAQVAVDTPTNFSIAEVTDGGAWEYVWQFTDNTSEGSVIFPQVGDNLSAGEGGTYGIIGFWIYFEDPTPLTEFPFVSIGNTSLDVASLSNDSISFILEIDGDIRVIDDASNTEATITAPFSAATWHRVEIRYPISFTANGELQVWVDGTSVLDISTFSGQSGNSNYVFWGVAGHPAQTGSVFVYFAGGYSMINSAHVSDRLDSDFEVIGPYQDTAITGLTPDVGRDVGSPGNDDLDTHTGAGDGWETTNDIPFSDEATNDTALYTGDFSGGIFMDGGTRPGPASDSRVDGDTNIKAWKGLYRADRGNGGGTVWSFYMGNDSMDQVTDGNVLLPSLTSGGGVNYYFVSEDSTNMPTSSQSFMLGMGKDGGGREMVMYDWAGFVLHVPAVVTFPPPFKRKMNTLLRM